ncbi:hypothetical protein BOTBODRAFT_173193 [Botryobasidium botryosum FD-172 SS1]|uniref:Large ribosomal subunit protein mL49 n=1 Tax=Botryobasidium botryosum (strain FD-172 SS1) TaxID=930990 RepID=A0A067MXM8_BOTB1|nr:hypothetical protein BOTBODRAFT_173193 [Botryobasidium botryosum FD-172 SS1]
MFVRALSTRAAACGYHVARTPTNATLPVYTDIRNAASRVSTVVRYVRGDVQALRQDLIAHLSPARPAPATLPPPAARSAHTSSPHSAGPKPLDIRINPRTKNIEIPGNWRKEVVQFLTERGF